MRSPQLWLLVVLATLVSNAAGQVPPGDKPGTDTRPRFSADAIALATELSGRYELDDRKMPSGRWDVKALARLSRSNERLVRELAELAPGFKLLKFLDKNQGAQIQESFKKQAEELIDFDKLINTMTERIVETTRSPGSDGKGIRSAARILEDIVGSKPQKAVNKSWAIACMGNGLGNVMKGKFRELAGHEIRTDPGMGGSIGVTLETLPDRLGTITLTNRTDRSFHHALIITRLVADRDRVQAIAQEENLVGRLVLPGLGFSDETVRGSLLAAELRSNFNQQEKGEVVYVPEIPPGASVRMSLARPGYFEIASSADVSLWCDELVVECSNADNMAEARRAVATMMRRPSPLRVAEATMKPTKSATTSPTRARVADGTWTSLFNGEDFSGWKDSGPRRQLESDGRDIEGPC